MHISEHTGNQFLYATVSECGLGLLQLQCKIPHILLGRIQSAGVAEPVVQVPTAAMFRRVGRLETSTHIGARKCAAGDSAALMAE